MGWILDECSFSQTPSRPYAVPPQPERGNRYVSIHPRLRSIPACGKLGCAMRLMLSMIVGASMCVALGACGAASSENKGQGNLGYTIAHAELGALATKAPSKHCLPPTTTGLNQELVPGTPCAIILSRYAGLPAHVGTKLVGRVELRSPSLLRSLTSEFNALPSGVTGTIVCPNDRGSEIVASLKYPHHQALRLTITLTGCPGALRGSVSRSALGRPGEKLIGRLERLVARR